MQGPRTFAYRVVIMCAAMFMAQFLVLADTANAAVISGDVAPRGAPDGELNIADVLVLQRLVMGIIAPTPQEILAGDVAPLGNPDGVLDVSDTLLVMRAVLGEITLPPPVDNQPPPPAQAGTITVSDPVNGVVSIAGGAGSVEAGAQVSLVNYETGAVVQVTANPDGSFSANLNAADQQVLGLTVIDATGNQSFPISLGVGDILTLAVTSPVQGANIADDRVLVTGTFNGPLNTSVTVNGIVACTHGNTFFASDVPLVSGANSLEVTVQMADGLTLSRTLAVSSTGIAPLRMRVDPPCGIAPHTTQFSVESTNANYIVEVELDIDNDGIVDHLVPGSALPFEYIYMGPRSYQASATVHVSGGAQYVLTHPIYVTDVATADLVLRDAYAGMLRRLTNGALDGALNEVSGGVYEKYRQIFTTLQPNLPSITSQLGTLNTGSIGNDMAEYIVTRTVNGTQNAYFVYFLKGEDGIWRIDGM